MGSDLGAMQALAYGTGRTAFGQPVASFQSSKFAMAEVAIELAVAEAFVDDCVLELDDRLLTSTRALMAKWWCTEIMKEIIGRDLGL